MFRIKRTYDPPVRGDGRRILVERLYSAHDVLHNGAVVLRDYLVERQSRRPRGGSAKVRTTGAPIAALEDELGDRSAA